MLLSQAYDKNYIDKTNDSLINIAVEYYSKSDDTYENMLSQYYYGRIKENAKQYSDAIVAMFNAVELAEELQDNHWLGLIYRSLSDIYQATFNTQEELLYAEKELYYTNLTQDSTFINYAKIDLARANFNSGNFIKSIDISSKLIDPALKNNDIVLYAEAMRINGISNYAINNFIEARNKFHAIIENGLADYNDSIELAQSYLQNNEIEESKKILIQLNNRNDKNINLLRYNLYKRLGDSNNALQAIEKYNDLVTSNFINRIDQDITSNVISSYDLKSQISDAKAKSAKANMWLIIISALFLIATIIFIAFQRYNKQQKKIEQNILLAENLQEIIIIKEIEATDAQKAIKELLVGKFSVLDELCRLVYESNNTTTARKLISDKIDKIIDQISNKDKTIQELEDFVNTYHNNIMGNLRKDLPNLKEIDYRLFLFTVLGFSLGSISLFAKVEKISSIYERKRRLKNKLQSLNSDKKEIYLDFLS